MLRSTSFSTFALYTYPKTTTTTSVTKTKSRMKTNVASPQRLSRIVAQQPIRPMMKSKAPTAMITTAGKSVYTSSKKWS